MIGIEKLNNTGIQIIGSKKKFDEKEKTYIVVGVARGGTSLVAGVLDTLGVYTGEKSVKPVFEDVRLANTIEQNNITDTKKVINEYNSNYTSWCFKRPSIINYLSTLDKYFRNPIYLFIFKDIFAVSNRNSISMKTDVVNGLSRAYDDYGKILKFISKKDLNGLLLSYEKVMQNKEDFVDTLIDIIGVTNVSPMQRNKALEFIEPNPTEYLNASRVNRGIGQIGTLTREKVQGWGKYIESNKPAIAELYINNKLVDSMQADQFRQHLVDKNVHPTGMCGFLFDISTRDIKKDDVISVKLSKDAVYLKGSNETIK